MGGGVSEAGMPVSESGEEGGTRRGRRRGTSQSIVCRGGGEHGVRGLAEPECSVTAREREL